MIPHLLQPDTGGVEWLQSLGLKPHRIKLCLLVLKQHASQTAALRLLVHNEVLTYGQMSRVAAAIQALASEGDWVNHQDWLD